MKNRCNSDMFISADPLLPLICHSFWIIVTGDISLLDPKTPEIQGEAFIKMICSCEFTSSFKPWHTKVVAKAMSMFASVEYCSTTTIFCTAFTAQGSLFVCVNKKNCSCTRNCRPPYFILLLHLTWQVFAFLSTLEYREGCSFPRGTLYA